MANLDASTVGNGFFAGPRMRLLGEQVVQEIKGLIQIPRGGRGRGRGGRGGKPNELKVMENAAFVYFLGFWIIPDVILYIEIPKC